MAWCTLAELHDMFLKNEFCNSGPVKLHVVNYEATNEFPHKFTYPGCAAGLEDGRMCRRSVRHYSCNQHADEGKVVQMLRFDLMLSDGSDWGKPIKSTMFSPLADKFLDSSALEIASLTEFEQIARVQRKIRAYPMLKVRLNVSPRGIVVQSFTRCTMPRLPQPAVRSIRPSPDYGSPSFNVSSAKKKEKGGRAADLDSNEMKVQQAMDLLRSLRFGHPREDE